MDGFNMDYTIIIPTCKPRKFLNKQLNEILFYSTDKPKIVTTCAEASAAVNRNIGLNMAKSEFVIMCDDDIHGFFQGWDRLLILPMLEDENIVMVSACLVNIEGGFALMMNIKHDLTKKIQVIDNRFLPSSCIAFRKDTLKFDEEYIGSGWEDSDFCRQMQDKYPCGKFVINNSVRLIHDNNMTNQTLWGDNSKYYAKKWGLECDSNGRIII